MKCSRLVISGVKSPPEARPKTGERTKGNSSSMIRRADVHRLTSGFIASPLHNDLLLLFVPHRFLAAAERGIADMGGAGQLHAKPDIVIGSLAAANAVEPILKIIGGALFFGLYIDFRLRPPPAASGVVFEAAAFFVKGKRRPADF